MASDLPVADLYVIVCYPQTVANCSSLSEVDRRLREMRHLRPLTVRRLTRRGWEDITMRFDHVLRLPPLPEPE
jgi:hypothetical protein